MTMLTKRIAGLLAASALVLSCAALPGRAEGLIDAAPAEAASTGTERPLERPQPDAVELAALYYYASERQEARVQAEAARLKLKYPGFDLPKDLFAPQGMAVSEAVLWALYEKDDFAGIEAKVSSLAAEHPGWQPSEDFARKLARRKLRVTMSKAYEAKDWAGVIAAGASLDAGRETEADLLWMLADACHEAGNKDEALSVLKAMLFRPKEARLPDPVLVATLQKAGRDVDVAEVREAVALIWPEGTGKPALRPIEDGFIRSDIADFNARAERREPVPDKDIQRLRDLIAARGETSDMSLLGWYFLKLEQPKEAEPYFRRALDAKPSAEFAKGLYLSLARSGREAEAADMAAAHAGALKEDADFLLNALGLRFARAGSAPVDAKLVEAYSAVILQTKSAAHAEILGWYAFNAGQFRASEAWFAEAWNWEEKPDRLKGLALAYQKQGKKKAFKALRAKFGDLYPDMWAEILKGGAAATASRRVEAEPAVEVADSSAPAGELKSGKTARTGYLAAFEARRYGDCVSELDRLGPVGQLAADAELIRGWCHLSLNHIADARTAFAAALAGKGRVQSDAAYGAVLAALRVKLTDEAEAIRAAYPLPEARDREVRAEIYWQRARSAFDRDDFQGTLDALNARLSITPESSDLSTLRAWAHAKLGHRAEAKAIFQKLNRQFSNPDMMRGLAAMNETSR